MLSTEVRDRSTAEPRISDSPSAAVNEHTDADRFAADIVKSGDHIPNAIPRSKDIVNDQGALPGTDLEASAKTTATVVLFPQRQIAPPIVSLLHSRR